MRPIFISKLEFDQKNVSKKAQEFYNKTFGQGQWEIVLMPEKPMTFMEVLRSRFKYLVESIEHGSSDLDLIVKMKEDLYQFTGYQYID